MDRRARVVARNFPLAGDPGLLADRDGDVRVLAEAAAVRSRCAASSPTTASRSPTRPGRITTHLDQLGLYTTEAFQKAREEVIARQQQEMLELSTPVVKLWDGILALPLIGTLDSARTQVVMESLLQRIVETGVGRSRSSTSPACRRSTRWSRSTC